MTASPTGIEWSKRVPAHKIRQLYESEAQGRLDEELLEEVGFGIYACCQDLLELAEANRGRVKCPNCGNIILRRLVRGRFNRTEVLHCEQCAWEIACGDYHPSLRRKKPAPPYEPEELYRSFIERWTRARSAREKLLLIDRLIHEWHVQTRAVGWPLGTSVIRATAGEMIALLEGLAYGPSEKGELAHVKRRWHSRLMARRLRFDLEAAARKLGIKGAARLRKEELIEAIERLDPHFFDQWIELVYGIDPVPISESHLE